MPGAKRNRGGIRSRFKLTHYRPLMLIGPAGGAAQPVFFGEPFDAFSPNSTKRRIASPRLRMRLANDQSSIALTSASAIRSWIRSVFN
jgi:hypothetical protein